MAVNVGDYSGNGPVISYGEFDFSSIFTSIVSGNWLGAIGSIFNEIFGVFNGSLNPSCWGNMAFGSDTIEWHKNLISGWFSEIKSNPTNFQRINQIFIDSVSHKTGIDCDIPTLSNSCSIANAKSCAKLHEDFIFELNKIYLCNPHPLLLNGMYDTTKPSQLHVNVFNVWCKIGNTSVQAIAPKILDWEYSTMRWVSLVKGYNFNSWEEFFNSGIQVTDNPNSNPNSNPTDTSGNNGGTNPNPTDTSGNNGSTVGNTSNTGTNSNPISNPYFDENGVRIGASSSSNSNNTPDMGSNFNVDCYFDSEGNWRCDAGNKTDYTPVYVLGGLGILGLVLLTSKKK